jgi:hypothetical protein
MTTITETRTRPYPLENVWAKKCGVFRITGPDPQWRIATEFCPGVPQRSRGTVEFGPAHLSAPAWVIVNDGRTRRLIAAEEIGWVDYGPTPKNRDLAAIHAAGPPGEPGSWTGERCPTDDAPLVAGTCAQCAETIEDTIPSTEAAAHLTKIADQEDPF